MDRQIPRPGEIYIHFKKKAYQIICVASHSETREKMVVYQALYGDFGCYVRPLEMFLSEVDHEKYPDVTQKYRFELADEVKENAPEDTMAKSLEVNPHQVDIVDLSNDEPAVSDAEKMKETEEQADPALLVFLDADTLEEKYEILKSMRDSMTDRLVDDFAVALDIVIPEGNLNIRYQQLLSSVRTMQRFENTRFR